MAGRLIQCPNRGCTWEQHHATHGLALKALDKHLKTRKGVRR